MSGLLIKMGYEIYLVNQFYTMNDPDEGSQMGS